MEEANAVAHLEGLAPVDEDEVLAAANGNGLPPLENGHAPVDEVVADHQANGNGHIVVPPVLADNEHALGVVVEEVFVEDEVDPVDDVVPLVEEPDDEVVPVVELEDEEADDEDGDGLPPVENEHAPVVEVEEVFDPVPVVRVQSHVPLPADRQMGVRWRQVLMDGNPIQNWFNIVDDVGAVVEQNWYAYRLRISSIYRSMLDDETVEDTQRRLAGNELLVLDNNIANLETAFEVEIRTRPREDFEAITEALDREIEGAFDLFGLEYQI